MNFYRESFEGIVNFSCWYAMHDFHFRCTTLCFLPYRFLHNPPNVENEDPAQNHLETGSITTSVHKRSVRNNTIM